MPIAAAFAAIGWDKPASLYERYLAEQQAGKRIMLVAFLDGLFAGYVNVVWDANCPPYGLIPEIQDFNVLSEYRRRGIGSRLMDAAEDLAFSRASRIGIGVGMYTDYGAAQRMYVRRGYIPDGRGLTYDGRVLQPGETVRVDDSLVLHLTKCKRPEDASM